MEVDNRFDTFANHLHRHVFVGRMDGVRLQAEAHENGLYTQQIFKVEIIGMLPPRRTGNGRLPNVVSKARSAAW